MVYAYNLTAKSDPSGWFDPVFREPASGRALAVQRAVQGLAPGTYTLAVVAMPTTVGDRPWVTIEKVTVPSGVPHRETVRKVAL